MTILTIIEYNNNERYCLSVVIKNLLMQEELRDSLIRTLGAINEDVTNVKTEIILSDNLEQLNTINGAIKFNVVIVEDKPNNDINRFSMRDVVVGCVNRYLNSIFCDTNNIVRISAAMRVGV